MYRRHATQILFAAGLIGALGERQGSADDASKRRFTLDLCPGRIGVRANQMEAIALAAEYGFESVEPMGGYLAGLSGQQISELKTLLSEKGLVWGAAGLPVDFRRDQPVFESGLKELPNIASGLQLAGVTRMGTWLSPSHQDLTYLANFNQHARRLRQVAKILADHGIRFGLEYVGPKTSWTAKRYPFIHTMAETKELLSEIDTGNLGFVLDSWHWYTAGEGMSELRSLEAGDVVAVDLNDAPQGIARDEQIDNRRELPGATGVIDLKSFLGALVDMGYDGPIRAEPFNRVLNDMDDRPAVQATFQAMSRAAGGLG